MNSLPSVMTVDALRGLLAEADFEKVLEEKMEANSNLKGTFFIENRKTAGYVEYVVHTPEGVVGYYQDYRSAAALLRQQVSDVQFKLQNEGYQLHVDGIPGPRTMQAFQDWKYKQVNSQEMENLLKSMAGGPSSNVHVTHVVGSHQVLKNARNHFGDSFATTLSARKKKLNINNAMVELEAWPIFRRRSKTPRVRHQEPMTKETYERLYDSIKAVIRSDVWFGWHVYVDQFDGRRIQYWWPSRRWASAHAQRAWAYQIKLLGRRYQAGQDIAVQAPLGVKHMTKSDLALSIEQEQADRAQEMQAWDDEFEEKSNG